MQRIRGFLTLLAVGILAACGGTEEVPESGAEIAEPPAAGMEGMEGMGGMQGMQMDGGMMEQMRAHMQAMQGASADSLMAAIPMHRQRVANMIAQMNREMRNMAMAADEEWTSTVDSLRQDLVRMPEMTAAEMRTFMPGHRARVMRLLEMHREMMREMGM